MRPCVIVLTVADYGRILADCDACGTIADGKPDAVMAALRRPSKCHGAAAKVLLDALGKGAR